MDILLLFRKIFNIAGITFLVIAGAAFIFILFSKNKYLTQREFDKYYRATLESGTRLPTRMLQIGPKSIPIAFEPEETYVIYVGKTVNSTNQFFYTEVYFADGGNYIGSFQRQGTNFRSAYSDGLMVKVAKYDEISQEEFLQHVPQP